MSTCSFDRLLRFYNKNVDLDEQLEIYGHLDRCSICRDAIYQLSRDGNEAFYVDRAYRAKPSGRRRPNRAAAGSSNAQR
jgi:hypothetical protein